MNGTIPPNLNAVPEPAGSTIRAEPKESKGVKTALFDWHFDSVSKGQGGAVKATRQNADETKQEDNGASADDGGGETLSKAILDQLAALQLSQLPQPPSGRQPQPASQGNNEIPAATASAIQTDMSSAVLGKLAAPSLNEETELSAAAIAHALDGASGQTNAPMRLTIGMLETYLPAALVHVLDHDNFMIASGLTAQIGNLTGKAELDRLAPTDLTLDSIAAINNLQAANGAVSPLGFTSGSVINDSGAFSTDSSNLTPIPLNREASPFNPVKTLNFQLEPEELGTLTIKMNLSKTRISMKIDVATAGAQTALTQSRDQIVAALTASGHVVDDVKIIVSPAPGSSTNHVSSNNTELLNRQGTQPDGGSHGKGGAENSRDGYPSRSQGNDGANKDPRPPRSRDPGSVNGIYV